MFAVKKKHLQIFVFSGNSQWHWEHGCLADPQTAHSDGLVFVNQGATMVAKSGLHSYYFLGFAYPVFFQRETHGEDCTRRASGRHWEAQVA